MKQLKQLLTLWLVLICEVTAYTASFDECGKDDGITASGTIATAGRTVAADFLPFGTIVLINGQRYVVEDVFGAHDGKHRIDIFMNSKHEAFEWGRRFIEVEILEDEI